MIVILCSLNVYLTKLKIVILPERVPRSIILLWCYRKQPLNRWFTNTKPEIKHDKTGIWPDYDAHQHFDDREFTADNILQIWSLYRILRHRVDGPPESSRTRPIQSLTIPATNIYSPNMRALPPAKYHPWGLCCIHKCVLPARICDAE